MITLPIANCRFRAPHNTEPPAVATGCWIQPANLPYKCLGCSDPVATARGSVTILGPNGVLGSGILTTQVANGC
jgi:hypothetical protein